MRFLADESCSGAVVRARRAAHHDVTAVADIARGATDERVLSTASSERRILITEDRDFGELVYGRNQPSSSVILVRFPVGARSSLPAEIANVIETAGSLLSGAFTVIEPGRVRISQRPS